MNAIIRHSEISFINQIKPKNHRIRKYGGQICIVRSFFCCVNKSDQKWGCIFSSFLCVCFSKLADVFFYYYYCCCISYQSFFRSFLQKFSLKIQSYTALWQYTIHTGIFSTSVVIIYMLLAEFSN